MAGMEPNPYESPTEAGYDNPLVAAARAWRKDRMMLIGCGLVIASVPFALMIVGMWLMWLFGIATWGLPN